MGVADACLALGEGARGLLSALLAGVAPRRRAIKFDGCLRGIHAGYHPIQLEDQAAGGLH